MENVNLEQLMNKVYAVIEYGGEYEDKWEHIIGVCSTLEIADTLKAAIEAKHEKEDAGISIDEIDQVIENYDDTYPDDLDIDWDKLQKMAPEHTANEWKSAYTQYYDWNDWFGVRVKEIEFYDTQKSVEEWKSLLMNY